jgi:hypothetical protein
VSTCALSELDLQLEALEADAPALAYSLRRAAEALRGEGDLKAAAVSAALSDFSARLEDVAAKLRSLAVASGASPPAEQPSRSLGQLRDLWRWLSATETLRDAVARTRRLVAANSSIETDPIRQAIAETERALQESLSGGRIPEELHNAAAARHPLRAIADLAGDPSGLEDSAWDECRERVRAAFGAPLAIAACRGRLACP